MTQTTFVFDLPEGERRKERGLELAVLKRVDHLERARTVAVLLATQFKCGITADDVQKALIDLGLGTLGNAAGALFRGKEWEFTGEWRKSARVSNHARQNRVWRLK